MTGAEHDRSGCFRLEPWPGGGFNPQESAAFSRRTPEAVSQLAEMTDPNQPFLSASEGQQVLISMAATSVTRLIQW